MSITVLGNGATIIACGVSESGLGNWLVSGTMR